MSRIAIYTLSLAFVMLVVYGFMLSRPALFRRFLARFPRSVWAARVLTAVDLLWVVTVMHHADFGSFNWIKELLVRFIPALGPMELGVFTFVKDPVVWGGVAVYFILLKYLDELLAVRALGGLLLLIANPILNAARWQETNWRWAMAVVAYLIVIKGLFLVMTPYKLRQWGERYLSDEVRCRRFGVAGVAFSLGLIVLALWAY
ncbi:MAG: hypothetical protein PHP44_09170 [Kiritimatiellae bacterium]|nr:hypothetical protein [Kiritimatiellia bacterium]